MTEQLFCIKTFRTLPDGEAFKGEHGTIEFKLGNPIGIYADGEIAKLKQAKKRPLAKLTEAQVETLRADGCIGTEAQCDEILAGIKADIEKRRAAALIAAGFEPEPEKPDDRDEIPTLSNVPKLEGDQTPPFDPDGGQGGDDVGEPKE